jgi:diguanylate cyclase (GGDEF)-like protein
VSTSDSDLHVAIAALWQRQRGEMIRRVEVVNAAIAALLDGSLTPELYSDAEREAHRIAGSAGSFGFTDASRHAREIELSLRAGASADSAPHLAELVESIRRDFEAADGMPPAAASMPPQTPIGSSVDVLVIAGGDMHDDELEAALTRAGLRAAVARREDDAALTTDAPITVVDLTAPLARHYMDRLGADADVAVIGVAADVGLEQRVRFAQRGGRMLLPGDTAPREIAEAASALRGRLSTETTRVLVVDDDAALLELTATILRANGLDVTALDDPNRFWQTLETRNPDVLLLDLEMPDFSGLELCRAVRADPRWAQLPVLFLTGRTEPETVHAVYAAGADDYMTKPVIEAELIQRISNRLERIRLLRDLADRDVLTGVANRRKTHEGLERLERLSRRYSQPLALAMIDLDHFKLVNDSFGHETGDEVLRRLGRRLAREFRGEDVVGRWGGEEFVIGMYGMPGPLAIRRMTRLVDEWKREPFTDSTGADFATSFTVGIAEMPGAADNLLDLIRCADAALYGAKAAGRGRVHTAPTEK